MRYLFCILIALFLAGDSGAGQIFRGSTSVSSEPATGTMLLGSATNSSADTHLVENGMHVSYATDLNATWSESASTTTVGTIEIYAQDWAGGSCKAFIMSTSGVILPNGISNALSIPGDTNEFAVRSFTMGTPPTISKGTTYRLGIVCDTDFAIILGYNPAGGTDVLGYTAADGSHTYTSPGNITYPQASTVDATTTFTGMRAKK